MKKDEAAENEIKMTLVVFLPKLCGWRVQLNLITTNMKMKKKMNGRLFHFFLCYYYSFSSDEFCWKNPSFSSLLSFWVSLSCLSLIAFRSLVSPPPTLVLCVKQKCLNHSLNNSFRLSTHLLFSVFLFTHSLSSCSLPLCQN